MNRKNIFLWALYDFGNSIVTVVFFLYFSQWLVIEKGIPDFFYNIIFTVGSLMLLFTAPIFGSIADKTGRTHRYLNIITVLTFLFYLGATASAIFMPDWPLLAVFFFLFANYFYQFSFVFYNAMLHHIAPPEKWGRISGIGQAGNWLGQITGLLITLPFVALGREQTFLPATILFFLLTLPMLIFFRFPKPAHSVPQISLGGEYKNQWQQFRGLIRLKGMGIFLLAYFFFNDAIITVVTNFPLYLENVFHISDAVKSVLLVGILLTSAIGAIVSGFVSDRIGLKRTLTIIIAGFAVVFPIIGITKNFSFFVGCTVLVGLLFGSIWTVSRAVMTALTPKEHLNFGFSFYTLAERVSTLIGPLTWGLITSLLVPSGPVRYRIALVAMTLFVIIGLYFVRKVEMPSH